MDPISLIGAFAGGGASIIGSLIGADAASDANNKNWQINLLNYYQRESERRQRIQQQERNTRDTKLGATDALGNRTRFVEGKGWVTDLSDQSEELQNAQLAEQMATLLEDLPRRREQQRRNVDRQRDEDFTAQAFMDELERVQREDPNEIRQLLYGSAARGVNEAFDEQGDQAMKSALRTGASNTGNILAALASRRGEALSKASQDAALRSRDISEQRFNNARSGATNLYNMFAERAARMPDVSYAPQNVGQGVTGLLSQFASEAGVGGRSLAEAFGARGGTVDYVQPDYGMANALASIGGVMGGLGERVSSGRRYNDALTGAFDYYDSRNKRSSGSY